MVRRKKLHDLPAEAFLMEGDDGDTVLIEIWVDYPEKGQQGTHRRQVRSKLFDKVMNAVDYSYLSSQSPITREHWRKMIYDEVPLSKFANEIKSIARRSGFSVGRTLVYELAREIQAATKAFDQALAIKSSLQSPQVCSQKNK
jgi:hypothetical protein